MSGKIPTPTCDKLSAHIAERNTICEFLEWLQEQGIELAAYHKHTDECRDGKDGHYHCGLGEHTLYSTNKRGERLALEFLEIDPKALEAERQAMLESLHP